MSVNWMKRHSRKKIRAGQAPAVTKHFKGNPYTQSARPGVSGFNGKVNIKFNDREMIHFLKELEGIKEIAATKEK